VHPRELEDVFGPFGRIRDIHVPQQRMRGGGGGGAGIFAFVEYEDPRAAHEACRARDGFRFGDMYLRVEVAKGRPTSKRDWPGPPGAGGAGGRGRKRSEHRVLVQGIPQGTSWQTLKDFVRAGVRDLNSEDFFNVGQDGGAPVGIVDFAHREAMDDAIRSLDGTDFRDRSGQVSVVRVVEAAAAKGGARGRSRSRSPYRGRSPGRSRSRSPSGGARYSRSRSRSRSPLPRARSRSPPAERELPREPEQEKTEPEKAEPEKAEPEKAEPEKAEPEKAEPEKAEPENAAPSQ
jgi:arginine/serine-rich splicing factor 1/9